LAILSTRPPVPIVWDLDVVERHLLDGSSRPKVVSAGGIVTITSAPKFERRGRYSCFTVIDDERHTFRLWGLDDQDPLPAVSLGTNAVYEFTFATVALGGERGLDLLRVRQDGETVYDVNRCEVHRVIMDRRTVRVVYGLPWFAYGGSKPGMPSREIVRRDFPHFLETAYGGCIPGVATNAEVRVCGECKGAYARWRAENPQPR
jgi:hypothetical protein